MTREKLIAYYTQRLEKVKAAWNEEKASDEYQRERCKSYVSAAQADLEAVKNGREWLHTNAENDMTITERK